jgi:type IV pilus assembly protein PilY1
VKDRFYIINDTDVYSVPASYKNIAEADMANGDNFTSASDAQKENGTYYILSGYGEKVLATSVTVADNILFTTYRPEDATSSSNCDADTGNTRLYLVAPIAPSGSNDEGDRTLEITDLAQGGIPPNPVVLFPPSDTGSDGDDDGDNQCPPGEVCECPEGEDCDPPEDSCEQLKAITAIGAETVNNSITRCDQLSRSYWRIN